MATTVWQQLGAYVYTGGNLGDNQIRTFQSLGGKWICPWIYQDSGSAQNIALIPHWRSLGVQVGGVANCFGGDPEKDAAEIAKVVNANQLKLLILDCEAAYQYPSPGCGLLPTLLSSVRSLLPKVEIGVTTNGMNDASIWNGGSLGHEKSCWNLKIRVSPQWFSSPRYRGSPWTDPVDNMTWMQSNGDKDNLHDPTQKFGRAIPFSYVHPVLEATGVEDAVLKTSLDRLVEAKKLGFTTGFCLFCLERVPPEDWTTLQPYRGKLWLD